MNRQLSDAELLRHWMLLREHGDDCAVARATGISRSTLHARTRAIELRWPGSLPPRSNIGGWAKALPVKPRLRIRAGVVMPAADVPEADPIQQHIDASESAALRRRVRELSDQVAQERSWRKTVESLRATSLEPAEWKPPAPAIAGVTVLTPVLFTSDFQVGEVVRPEEIDGINEYNQDIFVERYQALIDKTIELLSAHVGNAEFPGIYYLRGGDAISGEIHAELAETNDLSSVPAVRLLHRQEKEGIRRLREKFGRVRVLSIPGNHGRTTLKPRSSGYTERNFETLLSWWLASMFDDDPRVQFSIPASGDAWFQIERWSFLLAHGDRMGSKGSRGFIGPAAPIARGHQKLYQNWATTGRPLHVINTGHLHTSLKLERGLANGSLVGYNAYARDIQATPDAAKQWLYTVHRDRPIANMFEIELSQRPQRVLVDTSGFALQDIAA